MRNHTASVISLAAVLALAATACAQHVLDFRIDPQWEGFNNRLVPEPAPITRQSFGYRTSSHAGGAAGEIGGWISRSSTPATYWKVIKPRGLNDKFSASGKFSVTGNHGSSGALFGFFNENSRGWRTPNSLVFRLDGNRDTFWVFFEYGTQHRMTGGGVTFEGARYQTTKTKPFPADETPHEWALSYDPDGADGRGEVTFVLDGKSYKAPLAQGHKEDGATYNRFGMMNVATTGDAIEAFFDDLVLDGEREHFSADPKWEARGNEIEFADRVRRPFHDFGFSKTHHAGGKDDGEIGGIVWRGGKASYYAAPIEKVTLDQPLHESGKIALTGAAADSGVTIGFFNAESKRSSESLSEKSKVPNQLAVFVEGPSRIGHYFRPGFLGADTEGVVAETGPVIFPDGAVHTWSMDYDPKGAEGRGAITVKFDDHLQTLELKPKQRASGSSFDRFGIFNMHRGGHYVEVWLDDLQFTGMKTPQAR